MTARPLVGVGVTILRGDLVLLGRRRGAHGAGEYSTPGGHLEHMEAWETCGRRETREECGVEIANVRVQFVANVTRYAPRHYVHVGLLADWAAGEPRVLEPEKCDGWDWHPLNAPPFPLFEMSRLALLSLHSGKAWFDAVEAAGLHSAE